MGNWGISENATEKEKIKSKMADFLNGLNCSGDIGITTYDEIFDFSMKLLDEMYNVKLDELSKEDKNNIALLAIEEEIESLKEQKEGSRFNYGLYNIYKHMIYDLESAKSILKE